MPTKILIIEDNVDIRENTAELLELSGYHVETASDGIEGVRVAKSILPDVVICDIMMPNLDGFGVLQVFSNHPELSQVPFIFLTAKTDRADMRKGMEMGADESSIEFVEDRKGHDLRYSVDWTKINRELGYEPKVEFEDGLRETIQWYRDNEAWWKPLKNR